MFKHFPGIICEIVKKKTLSKIKQFIIIFDSESIKAVIRFSIAFIIFKSCNE